jgi:hypothetical protein
MEARARAVEILCDGFSHDARNPLNAVVIHLEVLRDKLRREQGAVPPAMEKNLKAIREQVHRLDELVRRFVEVAAPRRQHELEFDLAELVQSVVEQMLHHARLQRSDLRHEVQPGLRLAGSASELGVALALLLAEQLEAGQRRLLVRTESAGGLCRLSVEGTQAEASAPSLQELQRLARVQGASLLLEPNRVLFEVPLPRAEPALRVVTDDAASPPPAPDPSSTPQENPQ